MKKIFISSIVALALILGSAGSAQAAFTTYMTVGSTGAEVTALQTWLIASGFDIPAITTGAAAKGYFGQQTKSALVKYQASVGLPATGFFGPLTTAKVNGTAGGVVMTPVACPAGYTCTPTAGTPVVPVTPVGPLVMDGTDGSVTVSLSSYAGNNTIKKGETKDMIAVKLQATAGPVSVTRFDVRFNVRPWLYFSTITLKDSNGVVIATKNVAGQNDATELTVGTDYLVRFDGINAVVTPGTDRTLVVAGSVLSVTDKLSSDVAVSVSVPSSSIRTINGKGYTDSIGLGTVFTAGTTARTMTLTASGSTANILVKLNAASPDNRIVTTSNAGETNGVVLGKFDFKSENRDSVINTLKFTLGTNGSDVSTVIKRLYITDGSQTVQVDSVATSSTFSNLTFKLTQDVWKTITITADIAEQDATAFTAGTILTASTTVNSTNIVGVDSNFTTVTASGANIVAANTLTFLVAGASVTVGSNPVILTPVDNGTTAVSKKDVIYKFKVNNTGSNDIYVSKNPYYAVATSTTFAATSTTFDSITGGTALNGDSATVYIIPAGASREFTVSGQIDMTRNNSDKQGEVKITAVYFGDDTTNIQESNVSSGLDALTSGVNSFQ